MLRRIVLFALLGLTAASLLYFSASGLALAVFLISLILAVAAWPFKGREVTPQQWANELETHLLGTGSPYDWDDATSIALADERLEKLRGRLVPDFDRLDTPEKTEHLRKIIEALRRGEVP
jgi:hypothetical protein